MNFKIYERICPRTFILVNSNFHYFCKQKWIAWKYINIEFFPKTILVFIIGKIWPYLQLHSIPPGSAPETVLHGKPFDTPLIQYHSSIKFLGENLALGKPTLQSSVVEEGISSNAVDGNRHPDYSEKSCIQTDNQIESWWGVDLQDDFYVTSVVITNRRDCCSERLYNFEIKASGWC